MTTATMRSSCPATHRTRRALACVLALAAAPLSAQCALTNQPIGHVPDADGAIHASCAWDPDGAGPQPSVVVLGGAFSTIGNAVVRGLARFDPATGSCSALGGGITGPAGFETPRIGAVAVLPNNDLVVTGTFTSIGGVAATNVARWNGTTWQAMGTGVPFVGSALCVLPGGDLVAGGQGVTSGARILRWNGASWQPMGTGLTGWVLALATLPNGDLVAGGGALLGGANIVRWNGSTWSVFAGDVGGGVIALLTRPNGDLIVGGGFLAAGGTPANSIARWDGSAWSALGAGVPNPVHSLANMPNGDLVAGGLFLTAGGVPAIQVARWDGSAWSSMGGGLGIPGQATPSFVPAVRTLTPLPNGDVIAGGSFRSVDADKDHVARWNGTAWRPIAAGTGGAVHAAAEAANGDLVVGGEFTTFEGVAAARIARRSNGAWQALGSGLDGTVRTILARPNGDLVVGGSFTTAGGLPASGVARWDGSTWHAMGGGLPGPVHALAAGPNGQILASGQFTDIIAVWDGTAWHGTGLWTLVPTLGRDLVTMADGSVLAAIAGSPPAGTSISRWDGQAWWPVAASGAASGPLVVRPDNTIVAIANAIGGIAVRSWNGFAWNVLGGVFTGTVDELLLLPDGDLLAAGTFIAVGGVPINRLARWDGQTWSAVGAGAGDAILELAWLADDRVFVGGRFFDLLGVTCGSCGELVTPCAATASATGSGCVGGGGLATLLAATRPWLGAEFQSFASGLVGNSVAVEVLGFGATTLPLAPLFPQAGPGCTLTTTPDTLHLHVVTGPGLVLRLAVPDVPALVGATFRQQVVPFEFGGTGLVGIAATNSLQLQIGSY